MKPLGLVLKELCWDWNQRRLSVYIRRVVIDGNTNLHLHRRCVVIGESRTLHLHRKNVVIVPNTPSWAI